jgi:hypothetical protein
VSLLSVLSATNAPASSVPSPPLLSASWCSSPYAYALYATHASLQVTLDQLASLLSRGIHLRTSSSKKKKKGGKSFSSRLVTRRSAQHLFYDDEEGEERGGYDEEEGEEWDEDADAESLSTATDGSSIHTPISTPPGTVESRRIQPPTTTTTPTSSATNAGSEDVSAEDEKNTMYRYQYTALERQAGQLTSLLRHLARVVGEEKMESRQVEMVAEVKARRRAWLNRSFKYVAGADEMRVRGGGGWKRGMLGELGLGTPRVSSPLARCEVVTPENSGKKWAKAFSGSFRRSLGGVIEEAEEECAAGSEEKLAFPTRVDGLDDPFEMASVVGGAGVAARPRVRVRTLSTQHSSSREEYIVLSDDTSSSTLTDTDSAPPSRPSTPPPTVIYSSAQQMPLLTHTKLPLQHLFDDDDEVDEFDYTPGILPLHHHHHQQGRKQLMFATQQQCVDDDSPEGEIRSADGVAIIV